MLPPNIEEKIAKARELKAEAERLIREAEAEYFTRELLDRFWQRYVNLSQNEIIPLIVNTQPGYDDEFAKCYQYCRMHGLYGFGMVPTPKHNPPMPVDEAKGPAPVVDFESRKAAADRIRDDSIAKAGAEQIERGELPPEENFERAKRLAEIAEESAHFEQRVQEGRQIEANLSAKGSRSETQADAARVTAGFRAGESAANEIRDRLLADAEAERIKREPKR